MPVSRELILSPRLESRTLQQASSAIPEHPSAQQASGDTGGNASRDGHPSPARFETGPPTGPPTPDVGDRPRQVRALLGKPGDFIVDDSGCWIWQLKRDRSGYGRGQRAGRGGGWQMAHRWYYQRLAGQIPEGAQLDHLCRNRACVNPDHLEPVTNAENSRRGAKTTLTQEQVDAIRASSEPNRETAKHFGVSVWHVEKIKAGTRWSGAGVPA